jgi:protein-S-isoprenylcysteine O-methyltransferase Ste14
MTADSFPIVVIALAVSWYWLRVAQMARRAKRRSGRAANFIPTERTGRWNRILWVPAVAVWVAHPFYTAFENKRALPLAPLWRDPLGVKWLLSGVVVLCVVLTTICWRRMGKSWRMGIDPSERTALVVSGPYAYVRHPIYGLSVVMMSATMLAIASPVMLVAGAIHLCFLVWEARREERHLVALHGQTYVQYCARTGRFFPGLSRRRPVTAAH